jgi:CBS domain-containing protein
MPAPALKEAAMRLLDICTHSVATCDRGMSAPELARLMRERHVGDVVVVDPCEDGFTPVGIVTDRDLVVQLIARGADPERFCAEDLMSADVVTAIGSETVFDAIWHMRRRGVRRLPIVDAHNRLQGIVCLDDLTDALGQELSALARIAPRQADREQVRLEV